MNTHLERQKTAHPMTHLVRFPCGLHC